MENFNGVPEDEFKRICPELHKAITDSYKHENMYESYIYGMKFKFRKNSPDEMFLIKEIDDRTPVHAYAICKDQDGRVRYERFYPN